MKKIIMLLTAIAMLATSVIGVSAVDYTADDEGKYTGVAHTGLTANEYYGVVVVSGIDAAVDFDNTDNILYIDQVTADADGNITIPAFMTKGDTLVEGTVYIGGEGLDTATCIGYLKLAAVDDETFVISGTVSGYAGTILPTVIVTDGTTNYTANVAEDGTFSVEVPVLTTGAYTLTATKTSHLSYTKSAISAATTVNPVVKGGDIDGSGQADVLDISRIVNVFNSKTGDDNYNIANDLNESGQCDVLDISVIVNNFNNPNITE